MTWESLKSAQKVLNGPNIYLTTLNQITFPVWIGCFPCCLLFELWVLQKWKHTIVRRSNFGKTSIMAKKIICIFTLLLGFFCQFIFLSCKITQLSPFHPLFRVCCCLSFFAFLFCSVEFWKILTFEKNGKTFF